VSVCVLALFAASFVATAATQFLWSRTFTCRIFI